jgi:predicted ATP-dependent endonuclease of OLD family
MKIKSISIKNFRGIGDYTLSCDFNDFNLLIGDNGTSKTAILEAINLCLSPTYAASKLSLEDFYCGTSNDIEIIILFVESFDVEIPDLFGNTQKIKCKGISLRVKKRDRSAPGKAFNNLVVPEHFFLPEEPKGSNGWSISRKTGSTLSITERQLALSYASADYPSGFYFGKNRDRQMQKGFNSSLTNIIDDLNWRFEKSERAKVDTDKFKHKRGEIEKHIFDNTDGDTLAKTIDQTNKTLEKIGMPKIDLSLVKTLTPYDNSEIVKRFDGFELPVSLTGSGVEMITSLIFLETLAEISKEEVCIIIDEPELHLHPTLQDQFVKHLEDISKKSQVFISTHSPFFFKNCFDHINNNVLISEIKNDKVVITDAKNKGFGLLKWSPSWGEICYFAYDLPTPEFHDDLYATLQDKNSTETVTATETWLTSNGQLKEISWLNSAGETITETLMTYIRNRIHHGDNQNRPMYAPEQLKDSIERMIGLIN